MRTFIGCDFSINKPCFTVYSNGKFKFFFFPMSMNKKEEATYQEIEDCICVNRDLEPISPKKYSTSSLAAVHIKRAVESVDVIMKTLNQEVFSLPEFDPKECYFSSEGLSFGSQGDATLNLATYKAILLQTLYQNTKIRNIYTYAPISIKSTAGCSKKESSKDKKCMINAFINETALANSDFHLKLINGTLTKAKNYYPGVDDIVDSYWCLKTMYIREKLLGLPDFDIIEED